MSLTCSLSSKDRSPAGQQMQEEAAYVAQTGNVPATLRNGMDVPEGRGSLSCTCCSDEDGTVVSGAPQTDPDPTGPWPLSLTPLLRTTQTKTAPASQPWVHVRYRVCSNDWCVNDPTHDLFRGPISKISIGVINVRALQKALGGSYHHSSCDEYFCPFSSSLFS